MRDSTLVPLFDELDERLAAVEFLLGVRRSRAAGQGVGATQDAGHQRKVGRGMDEKTPKAMRQAATDLRAEAGRAMNEANILDWEAYKAELLASGGELPEQTRARKLLIESLVAYQAWQPEGDRDTFLDWATDQLKVLAWNKTRMAEAAPLQREDNT